MARTTAVAVGLIIEVDASISLTSFIEGANNLVTKVCADDSDYDATQLELIERWLSAHMYTNRDMRAFSERAGSVSQEVQSKVDLGFSTSHYGQMAMMYDYKGHLAALNERMKSGKGSSVGVTYLGKTEAEAENDGIS